MDHLDKLLHEAEQEEQEQSSILGFELDRLLKSKDLEGIRAIWEGPLAQLTYGLARSELDSMLVWRCASAGWEEGLLLAMGLGAGPNAYYKPDWADFDEKSESALEAAIGNGKSAAAGILLDFGAAPAPGGELATAKRAWARGMKDVYARIIRHPKAKEALCGQAGASLLNWALDSGHDELAPGLLEAGASALGKAGLSASALSRVAERGGPAFDCVLEAAAREADEAGWEGQALFSWQMALAAGAGDPLRLAVAKAAERKGGGLADLFPRTLLGSAGWQKEAALAFAQAAQGDAREIAELREKAQRLGFWEARDVFLAQEEKALLGAAANRPRSAKKAGL